MTVSATEHNSLHETNSASRPNNRPSAPVDRSSILKSLMMGRTRPDELARAVEQLQLENQALRGMQAELQPVLEQLRAEVDVLCAAEHYPCVITEVETTESLRVHVHVAGMPIVRAEVHPSVDRSRLRMGVRGYLSKARNCLLDVSDEPPGWKDIGLFEEQLEDGRILVKHQEQLIALLPVEGLNSELLSKGDRIGFDRDGSGLAYARVPSAGSDHLFAEEVPDDDFSRLGGLEPQIRAIKRAIDFRFKHPEIARRYQLPQRQGILLEGPPGNGKTRLARCAANYVQQLVPDIRSRFMCVTGSEDYSMWLGGTETRLRERFLAASEAAKEGPVVLFLDEIDALGRRRGTDYGSGAPDRILSTLLGLLDDVQQTLANVVVIAATNRSDQLDPGLTRSGRLDLKLTIPPPSRRAADAILRGYLARCPLAAPLDELVLPLISALFSPRGSYSELLTVKLNDGRQLTIPARELISGAALEAVVRRAAVAAADREAESGCNDAIRVGDLVESLNAEMVAAASLLSPANVKSYVGTIPNDAHPVDVHVTAIRGGDFVRAA